MNILKVLTEKRKTGNIGEDAAAKFLRKHGYRILERNYAELGAEIDIIAKNREYYVFVEVKTRTLGHQSPKEPRPASSVTPEKQGKIITVAKWYLELCQRAGRYALTLLRSILTKKKRCKG